MDVESGDDEYNECVRVVQSGWQATSGFAVAFDSSKNFQGRRPASYFVPR